MGLDRCILFPSFVYIFRLFHSYDSSLSNTHKTMSNTSTLTAHTPSKPISLSTQSPTTARPIHDLRTYDLFEGLPSHPSNPATDQQWSVDAQFYPSSALHATQSPPQSRAQDDGSIPYINLPKTGHSAQGSIRIRFDRQGDPYLDPVIERLRISKRSSNSRKTKVTSLLDTCDSFGIVGDPRGHERLAAFGRVPKVETLDDDDEEKWWTPDWAIVSGVLPNGTVRRVLERCNLDSVSANEMSVESLPANQNDSSCCCNPVYILTFHSYIRVFLLYLPILQYLRSNVRDLPIPTPMLSNTLHVLLGKLDSSSNIVDKDTTILLYDITGGFDFGTEFAR